MTDEDFEKATRTAHEAVSKKREISPESDSEPGSSARPTSLVVRNGHGTLDNSELRIQEAKIIEQARCNAELEEKLAAAERQTTEYKRKYILEEHKWRSQQGSLLAAQRDADELKRANPGIAHYMRARKEAEQRMKTQGAELRKVREKLVELEYELRAETRRTTQLEASIATAEVQAREEKIH